MKLARLTAALLTLLGTIASAQDRLDLDVVARIRNEGFRNSKAMETARALTDRIGPRLTGSPDVKEAEEWCKKQFAEWGLANAHLEAWSPFGRGWKNEFTSVRMVAPDTTMLVAVPKAWTPGTEAAVKGQVVKAKLAAKEDLEKQKGKLAGKIVLLGDMPELKPIEKGMLERYDEKGLTDLAIYRVPAERMQNREEFIKRREFRKELNQFLIDEKVLVVIDPGSGGDGGTFDVGSGGSYKPGEPIGVPSLVMSAEHYGRVARLLADKVDVELEIDVRNTWYDDENTQYNVLAELPGTDKNPELVMIGAHLDSWHSGTGATDNGAGVVAVMEAMRILKAIDAKPKRTIRIALWTGEEQGLLGSRGYVKEHFGAFPEPTDPVEKELPMSLRKETGALTVTPEHAKLAAYFNLDNGTGKVRGIYTQENLAVGPIFKAWLEPLHDLEATTVTTRNTGGTDHLPFDAVGLPGFQFIQDNVEYSMRTHHSNYDVYERLQREDLMQASVVIATFAYNAAMRAEKLPRKPLPKTK